MADDIMGILEKAIAQFSPGGEFAKSRGEQLETKRGKYTAAAQQSLVGAGLSGTTVTASVPAAFEEEVARPYQTETDLLRSSRLMEALMAKAGFLERQSAAAEEQKRYEDQLKLDADALGYQGGGYSSGGGGGGGSIGSFFNDTSNADRIKASSTGGGTGGPSQHLDSGSYAGINAGGSMAGPMATISPELAKKFGMAPSISRSTLTPEQLAGMSTMEKYKAGLLPKGSFVAG